MKTVIKGILLTLLLITSISATGMAQRVNSVQQQEKKSESEAWRQSIINTIMPVAIGYATARYVHSNFLRKVGGGLAVYGLIVGPSTGNFYANDGQRGMMGMLTRAAAGYVMKDATREILSSYIADPLGWDKKEVSLTSTRNLIAGSIFVASMVYNVISTRQSVKSYNRSYAGVKLNVQPSYDPLTDTPLLTARITF